MTENVEPGVPLAYSEELLPGNGTYDDGQQIRAALFGTTHIDAATMTVSVRPAGKPVAQIEKGDIVIGRINYTKPELASVQIIQVRGKEGRSLLQQVEGTLHVSKIDGRYIKDLQDEYRCGDVIRARVISLKGGPQLATDGPELGVVAAFSPEDLRRGLDLRNGRLVDPETGAVYRRKVASDYGQGKV